MMDGTGSLAVEPEARAASWGIAAALALLAVALLLAVGLGGPPEPRGKDAPVTEFSAERAREILRGLLGDGAPHPVGSPANARIREGLMSQLRWLGLAPEVQEAFACSPGGNCARVRNVLARLPGKEPGRSVLLMAHYDSVPAGPGAGDDMAGTAAILEIARNLKSGPPLQHGVILLLNEGEEAGLLGARAFKDQSPWAKEVGAIVNLEARGSSGPSLMFETIGEDAWPVARWASGARHPFTSSVFVTVYRSMPNDTDLTVFKGTGIPGMNFAFIDGPTHYHTPLDNFANLSAASLQHHGENALAAVRGLADAGLGQPHSGQAVFFDFLRAFVVRWPAALSPLLGALALALTIGAAFLWRRRGFPAWGGSFILGFLAALAALLLTLAVGFGVQTLVAPAFGGGWVARPLPAIAAFWLIALAVPLGLAGLLPRRAGLPGLWAGVWVFWALLGLILGLVAPGVSYLFLVPALVAGACGLLLAGSAGARTLAAIVPVFVAALLWFPILRSLYLGLGLPGLLAAAILLSLVFSALAPLMAGAGVVWRKWLPLGALAAAVLLAVMVLVTPSSSPESPRMLNVTAHEDAAAAESRWVVRSAPPFPPAMRQAAGFGQQPVQAYPWVPAMARAFVAPATPLGLEGPGLAVLADGVVAGKRHLRLRLTSPRGAPGATVFIPAAAKPELVRIDGQLAFGEGQGGRRPPGPPRDWQAVTNLTLPPGGCDLEVVLGSTVPADWYVADRSRGLPASAQPLRAARPKDAVPIQDGDGTVVSRKVRI
ncbi:MAG: M28 family peptidase [Thermoanaerobaculia bacterium]